MLLIIIKLLEFHGFIQDTILGFKSHDWVTVTTCDHMTGYSHMIIIGIMLK